MVTKTSSIYNHSPSNSYILTKSRKDCAHLWTSNSIEIEPELLRYIQFPRTCSTKLLKIASDVGICVAIV